MIIFGILLTFVFCVFSAPPPNEPSSRSLLELEEMMSEKLHTEPITTYDGYGCFCGLGSKSNTPVDAIDRCCMEHDACYGRSDDMGCASKWDIYSFNCNEEPFHCETITCIDEDSCHKFNCECDRTFVNCLAKLPVPKRKKPCNVS
ncbi:phospholipase a2 domain-containing protein [Ditylenchus destructor]|uniref:Phospholipase A2 n=1 Tax=Ditylenchus destructor TaxID=166010 RepID=A0AAD4QX80_9BILA|nr:phospholipase a2 domain-containing protein [Ditylenchus destructor]